MPLELGIWCLNGGLHRMEFQPLDLESRLQTILAQDIAIVSPDLLAIGREVSTGYGGYIDILAIDSNGHLFVLELKKDKTPRDIVAQTLDYGSWVRKLQDENIAQIYADYRSKYFPNEPDQSLDEAFLNRFELQEMPDQLNEAHQLVIVASALDPGTERIVGYLAEDYSVNINAVFFRVFRDGEREYLCRAWLREPEISEPGPAPGTKTEWNGIFYAAFGGNELRVWDEAHRYSFISAGGDPWYSGMMKNLHQGDRFWLYIPGTGYVGAGEVVEEAVPIDQFMLREDEAEIPIISRTDLKISRLPKHSDDPEKAEWIVRVKWLKSVDLKDAVKEKGFYAHRVPACKPRTLKWALTVERLNKRFGLE